MNEDKKVSSFTYDLLERESQSEEQKERRAIRRKTLEEKAKVKDDPAKAKRAKSRKRTMLVLFLVVAVAGTFTVRSIQRMVSLTRERAMVQAQLEELEKRRSELENELLMVNSDEYVEQQARSQLHMIKPGEVLYIVPNSSEYTAPAAQEEDEETPADPADSAKP